MCQRFQIRDGRNANTTEILTGPKPANTYNSKDFTYEFY